MAEEIGFENGRNSNFQGLVTLTLTLDPEIRHTVVHHSSTSTYIPILIQIEETFCGRTDGRTYGRTDFSPSNINRLTFGSRPNSVKSTSHKKDDREEKQTADWQIFHTLTTKTFNKSVTTKTTRATWLKQLRCLSPGLCGRSKLKKLFIFTVTKTIEGLSERTEYIDIFLFFAHHSIVFCVRF